MKTLLLTFLLMAPSAHADILFLDLNNSPHEVAAARESAKKSNRELIVLPPVRPEDHREIEKLKGQWKTLERAYNRKCKKSDTPGCPEIYKKQQEAYETQRKKTDSLKFEPKMLEDFLAERESKNKPVTSVVVSGHDGTGSFSGEFGHVGDQQLAEIFGKFPQSKDAIRALHLWGCYTTSPGSLMLNWKKYFPNTSIISGYEGRAPLNDKPAGWHYLKGVLAKEEEMIATQDHSKLKNLLLKIPGANMTYAAVNVCDDYASYKESYNLKEMDERCKLLKVELEKNMPEYNCYLSAKEDKCKDPPTNVGAGAVRAFYEILHKSSACSSISQDAIYRTVSRDQAIRLVFAKEVQKNFHNIYRAQIAESDLFLDSLGAPPELRFTGLEKLTRQELMRRAEALREFVELRAPEPTQDPGTIKFAAEDAKIIALGGLQRALTDTLGNLSADCVPFNWTEPNMTEKSKCIDQYQLGTSSLDSYMADKRKLANSRLSTMAWNLRKRIETDLDKVESDKVVEAQNQVWQAMMNRIDTYTYARDGIVNPSSLEMANARLQWAEAMVDRAKKEVPQPAQDPATVELARKYNLLSVNKALKNSDEELKRYQEQLAKSKNEKETESLQKSLKTYEEYRAKQMLNQDILKRHLAGEAPDSEALSKARAELKEILWKEQETNKSDVIRSNVDQIKRILDRPTISAGLNRYLRDLEETNAKLSAELAVMRENKESVAEALLVKTIDLPDYYSSEIEQRKYQRAQVAQDAARRAAAAAADASTTGGSNQNPFGSGGGMFGSIPSTNGIGFGGITGGMVPPQPPTRDGSNVRPDSPDEPGDLPQSQLEREPPGEDAP